MEDNNKSWGRKGPLPYTLACTVKSKSSLASLPTTKTEDKEEKKVIVPARVGLSSYLCRLYPVCVSLSMLGGGIHPTIA
jgi:hypothetical protein